MYTQKLLGAAIVIYLGFIFWFGFFVCLFVLYFFFIFGWFLGGGGFFLLVFGFWFFWLVGWFEFLGSFSEASKDESRYFPVQCSRWAFGAQWRYSFLSLSCVSVERCHLRQVRATCHFPLHLALSLHK